MKTYNVFDKESKIMIGCVTLHSSATKDNISKAVNTMVNTAGYNLQSVLDTDSYLIVEEG